ncbi:hypothetical protein E4U32_006170 [Claviceps aff. humidiphila group G2b]|nr:hypothetical protein E4U32_006170 [Claviceps aff. humidiphila group G2b]
MATKQTNGPPEPLLLKEANRRLRENLHESVAHFRYGFATANPKDDRMRAKGTDAAREHA